MSSEEIRQSFLDFFKGKRHAVVFSSSLIPDDPSVLLTTAGMQQFKKYYTSELNAMRDFGSQRTVSVQKCFRTSDIESVGDKTHMTFFEMLGNFSFGPVGVDEFINKSPSGYFKRASLHWAFEFITQILNISTERITVSVFKGDKEVPFDEKAFKIWHEEIGIQKEKIILGTREDNFWGPTGEEGPCGPCSEIYIDNIEVWNMVFNEYYKEKDGKYRLLENPGVDTGMGLERLTAVINGVDNVFETDIFRSLVDKINELAPELDDKMVRIFSDHLRASIFLIANGVMPSNKEAGYILRRLLRRIMAYAIKYDIHADLFPEAVEIIKDKFANIYPEVKNTKMILDVLEDEKVKFQEAIGRGMKELDKVFEKKLKGPEGTILEGVHKIELTLSDIYLFAEEAFNLYQTYGLTIDIIRDIAKEKGFLFDEKKFDEFIEEKEKKHQELSRTTSAGMFKSGLADTGEQTTKYHTATHLLLAALRQILGEHVFQRGSNITAERIRFDFSHPRKMTPEELKKVEDLVNEKIQQNLPVLIEEMPLQKAKEQGAMGVFEDKYEPLVKVYTISDSSAGSGQVFSKEICGGPHVNRTGELGQFKITKEEASSAGVRRIKAVLIQK